MLRRGAVDPDGHEPGRRVGERRGLLDRRAVAEVTAVGARDREPADGRRLGDEVRERLRLGEDGDRLAGEEVRTGVPEDPQPGPVPVAERGPIEPVAARVLGAVGEVRAVRPDRRGDEERPRVGRCDLLAVPFARLGRQLDAPAQEARRRVALDPAGREALERRLVAGGDRDAGAGAEVRQVGRDDRLRLVRQEAGRPQAIGQVVPGGLQLGREAAVDDDDAAGEERRQRVDRTPHGSSGPRQPAPPMSMA